MSKSLGLDLETNSIGWAIIDNNRVIDCGVRVFPIENKSKYEKPKKLTLLKTKNLIYKNFRILILSTITLAMFILSLIFAEFWQLFLNLGIGGLISILTLENKKNK